MPGEDGIKDIQSRDLDQRLSITEIKQFEPELEMEEKRYVADVHQETYSVEELSEALSVGEWAVKKWTGERGFSSRKPSVFQLSKIKKGLLNPSKVWRYLTSRDRIEDMNRAYYNFTNSSEFYDSGIDIFEADWDNLIILDACRFDMFEKCCGIQGDLQIRQSKASMTHEWLEANFKQKELHNVVYVSANGNYFNFKQDLGSSVFKYIALWDDEHRSQADVHTTLPEIVTNETIEVASEYPNKRLLIHYIQPHHPYIGPKAKSLDQGRGVKMTVERNSLSREDLIEIYKENADIVIDEVERLLPHLPGKTVVSSDHGEMLGERSFPIPVNTFEHPPGIYTPELVDVPWFVYQNGKRKEITEAEPEGSLTAPGEDVEEHLEAIGYRM